MSGTVSGIIGIICIGLAGTLAVYELIADQPRVTGIVVMMVGCGVSFLVGMTVSMTNRR